MNDNKKMEAKLETLLRNAGRNIDLQTTVPPFWRIWLKTRALALFGSNDLQAVFMPAGAVAVVMAALLIGQLLPNVNTASQGDNRYVSTIDMTAFEDVWDSPSDSLLTMDTIDSTSERNKNRNQMDARGNGHTQ